RLGRRFRNWRAGDFQAWADFKSARLDYWEGWPQARELDGRVDFIGRSMQARVDQGRLGPVPLSAERIAIDNLAEPRVAIDLAAETVAAADVYATVAGLPLEG